MKQWEQWSWMETSLRTSGVGRKFKAAYYFGNRGIIVKRFPKFLWIMSISMAVVIAFTAYWGYQYSMHVTPQKALLVYDSTIKPFETIPFAKGVVLVASSGHGESYMACYLIKGFWGWQVSQTAEAAGKLNLNNNNVDFETLEADGQTLVWGTTMTAMKEIVYSHSGTIYTCDVGKSPIWYMILPFTQTVFSHSEWTMVLSNGKTEPLFK